MFNINFLGKDYLVDNGICHTEPKDSSINILLDIVKVTLLNDINIDFYIYHNLYSHGYLVTSYVDTFESDPNVIY